MLFCHDITSCVPHFRVTFDPWIHTSSSVCEVPSKPHLYKRYINFQYGCPVRHLEFGVKWFGSKQSSLLSESCFPVFCYKQNCSATIFRIIDPVLKPLSSTNWQNWAKIRMNYCFHCEIAGTIFISSFPFANQSIYFVAFCQVVK